MRAIGSIAGHPPVGRAVGIAAMSPGRAGLTDKRSHKEAGDRLGLKS
ncbi:MAG: hypothetical protein PHY05_11890 [Methanothrix sp.]|nr:hypothetical protein [Methanothrix sp.]